MKMATCCVLELCCAAGIADDYQRGKISFEQAKASLNKYTTTLHGINSAVIKLGCAPHQKTHPPTPVPPLSFPVSVTASISMPLTLFVHVGVAQKAHQGD